MARWLYSLLLYLSLPLVFLRLLWRSRRQPDYLHHLPERFGFLRLPPQAAPLLWFHAVSVGETRAAQPLLHALLARYPEHHLLLTCTTPTGRATALELFGQEPRLHLAYAPYDLPDACHRLLRRLRPHHPAALLLMETEVWPNQLAAARAHGLPVLLVNARLSARSAAGYQRLAALTRPAFAALTAVAAQSPADAERLAACGSPPAQLCGNLKFDVTPPPERLALGADWRRHINTPTPRPVWLAASSREGEEELILAAFAQLRQQLPHALLLLVPRHPQRFGEVAALADSRFPGQVVRRSEALPDAATAVWLGDSMGEMAAYFAAADLAVMGGSLQPLGSQNLIEAAACGCPVLLGPHTFNFAQASRDALEAGAARQLPDLPVAELLPPLAAAVTELLTDPAALASMRQAAHDFATAHRGATERTLAVITPYLTEVQDSGGRSE